MNKQTTLKTVAGHSFCPTGCTGRKQKLLTVTPGVNITDALEEASRLINIGSTYTLDAGMADTSSSLHSNFAFAAHHALESAHAIVESVLAALQEAQTKG